MIMAWKGDSNPCGQIANISRSIRDEWESSTTPFIVPEYGRFDHQTGSGWRANPRFGMFSSITRYPDSLPDSSSDLIFVPSIIPVLGIH